MSEIVLLGIAYVAVGALCVYLEARLTGDGAIGPLWMAWPFMVVVCAFAWATEWLIDLGERHRGS